VLTAAGSACKDGAGAGWLPGKKLVPRQQATIPRMAKKSSRARLWATENPLVLKRMARPGIGCARRRLAPDGTSNCAGVLLSEAGKIYQPTLTRLRASGTGEIAKRGKGPDRIQCHSVRLRPPSRLCLADCPLERIQPLH